MTSLLLVRHAQPEVPAEGDDSHWTDTVLTPLGRRQAASVAVRLKKELGGAPCRVWSSDLRRAFQTAEAICREVGGTPTPMPGLREYNNGRSVGGSMEALERTATAAVPAGGVEPTEQAESWADFYGRVAASMERIVAETKECPAIVVSHYGATINIMNWWVGAGLNAAGDVPLSFGATLASLAVLKTDKRGKRMVERLNDTAHLFADGIAESVQWRT